jgi:hypothetical protein
VCPTKDEQLFHAAALPTRHEFFSDKQLTVFSKRYARSYGKIQSVLYRAVMCRAVLPACTGLYNDVVTKHEVRVNSYELRNKASNQTAMQYFYSLI